MRRVFVVLSAVFISGCAIDSINKQVVHLEPYKVKEKTTRSISVTKTTNSVDNKKIVGKFYGGTGCFLKSGLRWDPSNERLSRLEDIMRSKLAENGYTLLGKAHTPFNDEFVKQSELLLGGIIKDVVSNACYSMLGVKGELALTVEWEVYDTKTKQVVLSLKTEGIGSSSEFKGSGDFYLTENAYAMAVDNLLANEQFHKILISER